MKYAIATYTQPSEAKILRALPKLTTIILNNQEEYDSARFAAGCDDFEIYFYDIPKRYAGKINSLMGKIDKAECIQNTVSLSSAATSRREKYIIRDLDRREMILFLRGLQHAYENEMYEALQITDRLIESIGLMK